MVTFTKGASATGNTVEIDINGAEVHYVSVEAPVKGKAGGDIVYVGEKIQLGNSGNYFRFKTTDINGRPSDDGAAVAEWLRDNYFTGLATATGGGGGGDASAANQLTMIAELQDIEADVEAGNVLTQTLINKTPTAQISEVYDHRSLVYDINGRLDYVSYKTGGAGGSEVARLTFTYDGNDNIVEITKT